MLTNLSLVRGDTFTRAIEFLENNQVLDITNFAIFFTLKKNWQLPDSEASLQKIITTHSDPTHGKSVLELLPEDTQNLEPFDYDFDLGIIISPTEIYTVLRGKFTIEYDVTFGTAGTAGT
jgi:hypothetical protein